MRLVKQIATNLTTLSNKDHRSIGLRQKLFSFPASSPGSPSFWPRGCHIKNKLIEYLRQEYQSRGIEEIETPNVYETELYKTSGHYDHYKDNMIIFKLGDKEYCLKPMNCPGHCEKFQNQNNILASHQLPIRWADFGILHRREKSGALKGLTRTIRFQQDDAHIFCRQDQIESEVKDCLLLAQKVYKEFHLDFDVKLSLRPESYMGSDKQWNEAEEYLRRALDLSKLTWSEQKFEGAFYGPKIDLIVKDQRNRSHQCATIQLDFQLPENFELIYKDKSSSSQVEQSATSNTNLVRPVIIHRAILGSLERFIAMLAENCEGRWPFWLSPLQAQVIPIHENLNNYAKKVYDTLRENNFEVDCDLRTSNITLNKKIREALMTTYNLILIVGKNEAANERITCRIIDGKFVKNINLPMTTLIEHLKEFDKRRVDRADLELLKLTPATD